VDNKRSLDNFPLAQTLSNAKFVFTAECLKAFEEMNKLVAREIILLNQTLVCPSKYIARSLSTRCFYPIIQYKNSRAVCLIAI
jgi:hypothetical protein